MPRAEKKKTARDKKPIEQYEHKRKKRLNNPPVGLVTPATREVFLVSEVLGEVGREVAETVVADFKAGLQTYFGVGCQTFLLDEGRRMIEW